MHAEFIYKEQHWLHKMREQFHSIVLIEFTNRAKIKLDVSFSVGSW